jgi:hypothetical protein
LDNIIEDSPREFVNSSESPPPASLVDSPTNLPEDTLDETDIQSNYSITATEGVLSDAAEVESVLSSSMNSNLGRVDNSNHQQNNITNTTMRNFLLHQTNEVSFSYPTVRSRQDLEIDERQGRSYHSFMDSRESFIHHNDDNPCPVEQPHSHFSRK